MIDFHGNVDKLDRTSSLNGFLQGNGDRTVYLVADYRGTGYGGFGFGTAACNHMFGIIVDPASMLAIQDWRKKADFPSTSVGTGAGRITQTATLQGVQLSHHLDGVLIYSSSYVTCRITMEMIVSGIRIV